jgi:hypothetical protein
LAALSIPTLSQAADALAGKVDIRAASYVMVAWTTIKLILRPQPLCPLCNDAPATIQLDRNRSIWP